MTWNALDSFIDVSSMDSPDCPPAIRIIHLGGNDMTHMSGKALILKVIDDLREYHSRFPMTRIVWSAMIPLLVWGPVHDPQKMHKFRKGVNREVDNFISNGLGSVIQHPEITALKPELFWPDGVHLSDMGLEIFLLELQEGLWAELLSLMG
ncbi:hypothetical protein JRQ81_016606 [Phrynocephalus forsythii]|uniref:SGNH hydrolase-type esterase domain-containing protein n=1 Tax=Phrynocephalus forsythii TaxID=171643 RepID=A0A9Q0XTK0_9SAUR|nr:hypothetical protein JRQ81_016606 [Phrynocephalus forsythii]